MKQDAFEKKHQPDWDEFEHWVEVLSMDRRRLRNDPELAAMVGAQFPARYREVCHHLALARTRQYSAALQQRLNELALAGHQQLYRSSGSLLGKIGRFLALDFPRTFRERWRFVLASSLLFYLPAFGITLAMVIKPELIYSLMDPSQVSAMEHMYDPENHVLGRKRSSDTDSYMFGFYIYNNISIGFQTFAGGLLFGLGSLFYLVLNGLLIGAVAAHVTAVGHVDTFWPFVAGHSAFELTAITIFGAVGLMIGYGAVAPGRKRRWQAISDMAQKGMPLIYGGTLMLIAAAFIEAFWSSTTWPPPNLKYGIGLLLWLVLGLYFALVGRNGPE